MKVTETVPDALGGERLDRVVAILANCNRAQASELVDQGSVTVNGAVVAQRSRRVAEGDVIEFAPPDLVLAEPVRGDPAVQFTVVYEDDAVIVIDKPAGLVVHPGAGNTSGTLVHGLLARYPDLASLADEGSGTLVRPGIVHRLDKGTSGLLMVGRTAAAVEALIGQLSRREVHRHYQALAWGEFEATSGLIDAPVGRSDADPTRMTVSASGKEARTRYRVLKQYALPDPTALVECWLETGRTHQIRVHLAAIGHPVVGDSRYGGARNAVVSPRPWLHAFELTFEHPVTGETLSFTSPVPADLQAVLSTLS